MVVTGPAVLLTSYLQVLLIITGTPDVIPVTFLLTGVRTFRDSVSFAVSS